MRHGNVYVLLFILTQLTGNSVGQRFPLTQMLQIEMFTAQNDLRRSIQNQVNMQCLSGINQQLVTAAQNIANTCNPSQPANSNNGFAWYLDPTNSTGIEQFMQQVEVERAIFDYATNMCDTALGITPCVVDLFRQVLWYEAQDIGCGRAICPNGMLIVCGYTYKQNPASVPHILVPGSQPCQACPSGMACLNKLCCATTAPGPAPAPPVMCSTPPTMVPVTRIFNNVFRKNFLLTDPNDVATVGAMRGAQNLGVIGRMAQTNSTQCQYLLPVHRLYNRVLDSESSVVDPVIYQSLLSNGWRNLGVMGYAVQAMGVCNATVAIYDFFGPGVGILQVQEGPAILQLLTSLVYGYYQWRGVSYYIWP